jgi:hypothetical protein
MGREMPERCPVCGVGITGNAPVLCPECAHLLRWVQGYFAGVLDPVLQITTETTFNELGVESLDYMNWILEAEERVASSGTPFG